MADFEQDWVSRAIWRWQGAGEPPRRGGMDARLKVAISTPIALGIAWGIHRWKGHVVMPLVVAAIALGIGFCGVFVPPAFRAIERGLGRFGAGVATGLNWVLLAPLFFLVFAPIRLGLWLRGKDPMQRACPSGEKTYWIPRRPITRENYYGSQH